MNDYSNALLGAICGDIIGSYYEFCSTKDFNFELFDLYSKFTDDTVMTIAVANWVMNDGDLVSIMKYWAKKYPAAGYGGMFRSWLYEENPKPYNSFGNGSAMRVSSVGWAYDNLEETLKKAKESAEVTHNHPEGIKGAQATAAAIYLARTGRSKDDIRNYLMEVFKYNLNRTCEEIRKTYEFDVTCQGSVPESIIAFLESTDYESAIRLAVSLGGDADTMGAITGAIAVAYYGEIPSEIKDECIDRLTPDIKNVIVRFADFLKAKQAK